MNEIQPQNLTAQLTHQARGNPPSTTLKAAIGNFFPGLEFDLRNIWINLFQHLTLHEFLNAVIAVDDNAPPKLQRLLGATLAEVDGHSLFTPFTDADGSPGGDTEIARSNGLADVAQLAGQQVPALLRGLRLDVTEVSSVLQSGDVTFPAENAVDRDEQTPWITAPQNAARPEHLVVDLGAEFEIVELRLHPASLPTLDLTPVFPKEFNLDISVDGNQWTTVVQEQDFSPQPRQWNSWPITPTTVRFVRLNVAQTVPLPNANAFLIAVGDINVTIRLNLTVRHVFEQQNGQPTAVIDRQFAPPGTLTQSLCSPWQNDFRDCGCFYWAASRPDFVNVAPDTSQGNNWMDTTRRKNSQGQNVYAPDNITHDDLFRNWESKDVLKFVIGGEDED